MWAPWEAIARVNSVLERGRVLQRADHLRLAHGPLRRSLIGPEGLDEVLILHIGKEAALIVFKIFVQIRQLVRD